jgi:hypothetical protein
VKNVHAHQEAVRGNPLSLRLWPQQQTRGHGEEAGCLREPSGQTGQDGSSPRKGQQGECRPHQGHDVQRRAGQRPSTPTQRSGATQPLRVNGLNIPTEVESSNKAVKKIVYDSLLLPIFKGAVAKGDMMNIPPVENILENAHILPVKGDGKKPVIVRFFEREVRDIVFRNKKEHAPTPVSLVATSSLSSRI